MSSPSDHLAFVRGFLFAAGISLELIGIWLVVALPYPIIPGPVARSQFLFGGLAMILGSFLTVYEAGAITLSRLDTDDVARPLPGGP